MIQYIMIGFHYDYDKICFADFVENNNVIWADNTSRYPVLYGLQHFHISERINKHINLPFKGIWFNLYEDLDKSAQKVFIFSGCENWLIEHRGGLYIDKLRKTHPNSKFIMYLEDLISSFYWFDVELVKRKFDAVFTYDWMDSKSYNFIYCPSPYSAINIKNNPKIGEMDVYFCGRAKNRLNDLYHIYEFLQKKGLSCCFRITDVPGKQQIKEKGIIYNRQITYYENLQYVQKAKCLLEVIQKNSTGDTLRVKEALVYGKKLLTNNAHIKSRDFYDKNQIGIFSDCNNIDLSFFDKENSTCEVIKFSNFEEQLRGLLSENELRH